MNTLSFVNSPLKISIFFVFAIVSSCILHADRLPLRLNLTASMPLGFYIETSSQNVKRGDFVAFCLENPLASFALQRGYLRAGSCESGVQPLLKQVVGLSGDQVNLSAEAVAINGLPLPHSRTLLTDRNGYPLPQISRGIYKLQAHQLWLYGTENARSWDSRYIGIVDTSQVMSVMQPLWVWGIGKKR